MKLIYFDAGNPQKKKELEQLAKSAGYDFVPVTAMQTGQKIGYLAGVSGYRETPLPVIPAAANRRGYAFICAGDGRYDRPGAGAVKKEPDFDRSKGDRYAL